MKLLADENVPLEGIRALRRAKLDVAWIGEIAMGMGDADILRLAREQKRVLLHARS